MASLSLGARVCPNVAARFERGGVGIARTLTALERGRIGLAVATSGARVSPNLAARFERGGVGLPLPGGGYRLGMTRLVTRPELEQILAFCAEDPVERVFLEDVARRGLGRFAALEDGGSVSALCHIGANIVPSGRETGAFAAVAAQAEPRMMVGEERAVTNLWEALRSDMPEPIDDRPGQPVYVLEDPPSPGESDLRPAHVDDLDLLIPAAAQAYLEEVGVDAYERDPDLFEWRTRVQVEQGRSWIWRRDGHILFKAEASAWTEKVVQLQQVWVEPDLRGHGYAKQGLADLCRLLLATTPTVCLFVRPENAPAIALYESLGMRRTITYRSLIFG